MKIEIGDLRGLARTMAVLAELAPDRMALSQAIFFLTAAAEDLAGKRPTYTDVRALLGDEINRTLHTTYRIVLEPSRVYPKGLGWMTRVQNPNDNREWFLKLTPKGKSVVNRVVEALEQAV